MSEEAACYCVCHSPVASNAWCEHCGGDNEVTRAQAAKSDIKADGWHPSDSLYLWQEGRTIAYIQHIREGWRYEVYATMYRASGIEPTVELAKQHVEETLEYQRKHGVRM